MIQSIIDYYYSIIIQTISTIFILNNNIKKNDNMSFEPYLHNDLAIINKDEIFEYGNGYGQFTHLDMQKMMFKKTYSKPPKMIQTLPTVYEDLDETRMVLNNHNNNAEYNKFVWRQLTLFGMIITVSGYIIIDICGLFSIDTNEDLHT